MSGVLTQTNVTYKWEIDKFLDRQEPPGTAIVSPKIAFSDSDKNSGVCVLQLFPKGDKGRSEDYIGLFLRNIGVKVCLSYTLSIQDRNGTKTEAKTTQNNDIGSNRSWGFPKFLERDDLQDESTLLSEAGTLTIILDIHKFGPTCPVSTLAMDLKDSFEEMKYPDRQLVCHGQKFDCHQFLLASRSPYFDAMFSGGFKKENSTEITMDFVQPAILKEMLSFIYCGQTNNLKAHAVDLLKAADHCQIDNLKEVCGCYLIESLNVENCLDNIVLADKHNEENLKEAALELAMKNIKPLRQTDQWKEMKKGHPDLIIQIVEKVMDEKDI